jgi:hypothetical protein
VQQALRPSALVPTGFVVESAAYDGATTVITVRRASRSSPCPGCGTSSGRVHSRYLRHVADLPLAGRPVRLVVVARRFRCGADLCGRRIFTERFEEGVLEPWARRTGRLDHVIHHLGLALGGRPAASFAQRLMLPVSNDTLLRVVRKRGSPPLCRPRSWGSTTGHGDEISATERSFATWNDARRSLRIGFVCIPSSSRCGRKRRLFMPRPYPMRAEIRAPYGDAGACTALARMFTGFPASVTPCT